MPGSAVVLLGRLVLAAAGAAPARVQAAQAHAAVSVVGLAPHDGYTDPSGQRASESSGVTSTTAQSRWSSSTVTVVVVRHG